MKKIDFVNGETIDGAKTFNDMQNNVEEVFNGKESMGSIVVEDISCKNLIPCLETETITLSKHVVFDKPLTHNEYTLSVESITTDGASGLYLFEFIDVNNASQYVFLSDNVLTTTFATSTELKEVYIYSQNDYANSQNITTIFKKMMLEKGSTASEYTPYKKFSYNENESMGKIVVDDISCKNIFDVQNTETYNAVITSVGTNSISFSNNGTYAQLKYQFTLKKNTDYVLKYTFETTNPDFSPHVSIQGDNYWGNEIGGKNGTGTHTINFNSGNWNTIDMVFPINGDTNLTNVGTLSNVQLEEGDKVTPYTPYKNFEGRTDIITGQECPTNEYIDGKRVYVKRLQFDTSSLGYINIANNVKSLVDARMLVKQTGTRDYRPIPWLFNSTDTNWYGGFYITIDDNNKMYISTQLGSSLGDTDLSIVTIYYTKL